MKILEVNNIYKYYPNFTLENISFTIDAGKIVGLIGENGAGKTTLISIILQQIKMDKGSISFEGERKGGGLESVKQEVGFVLDECCFPHSFHAKDIDGIMKYIYKRWDTDLFTGLMQELKVDINKRIEQMSKGMKNKLLLAVALAHTPKLLVLDEVTSGLDPIVRFDVLKILKKYAETYKTGILFSTHTTSDLEKIADEFIFLHKGELVFKSTMKDLSEQYRIAEVDLRKAGETGSVVAQLKDGEKVYQLLKIDPLSANPVTSAAKIPDLERLMLIFIKGERNAGIN